MGKKLKGLKLDKRLLLFTVIGIFIGIAFFCWYCRIVKSNGYSRILF
ncbi:MAG: hypothetical protein LRY73_17210 [Bacillus sp. (in: Bacteria)]|nr:hypothetical protein [Bacillus sp. (in: firmicutes)]